jgi:hypothetical protein
VFAITSDTASLSGLPQDSQGCGTLITANGSFTTNGVGGTVRYEWIRKDGATTIHVARPPMIIAAGDTSAHSVVPDAWIPQSDGTEQLVFLSPSAPSLAPKAWNCNSVR